MRTAIAGAALLALVPQVAQAAMPVIAVQAVEIMAGGCGSSIAAPSAITDTAASPISIAARVPSKAAQIIGGASALDAIRAQQASAPATHPRTAGR